jgi:hypothetical protein
MVYQGETEKAKSPSRRQAERALEDHIKDTPQNVLNREAYERQIALANARMRLDIIEHDIQERKKDKDFDKAYKQTERKVNNFAEAFALEAEASLGTEIPPHSEAERTVMTSLNDELTKIKDRTQGRKSPQSELSL